MENQKKVEQKTEGQQVQTNVQAAEAPVQQTAPVTEEPKKGFGAWFKQHWKGVVGALAGTGAVIGSGVVAYKKGKAAGIMSVPAPQQEPDDYSLDPNR